MISLNEVNLTLDKVNDKLDLINEKNLDIAKVMKAYEVKRGIGTFELNGEVIIENLFEGTASISVAKTSKIGGRYPDHKHVNSIQYLICTVGSFAVSFASNYRIIKSRDCVSIPENTIHAVTALEDDSELISICVPEEPAYKITKE